MREMYCNTIVNLENNYLTIEYLGSRFATIENINNELNCMNIPPIRIFKSIYNYEEEGYPDYYYKIKFDLNKNF